MDEGHSNLAEPARPEVKENVVKYIYKIDWTNSTQDLLAIMAAYGRLMASHGQGADGALHKLDPHVMAPLGAFEEGGDLWTAAAYVAIDVAIVATRKLHRPVSVSAGDDPNWGTQTTVKWSRFVGDRMLRLSFHNSAIMVEMEWDKPLSESHFARWCGLDGLPWVELAE